MSIKNFPVQFGMGTETETKKEWLSDPIVPWIYRCMSHVSGKYVKASLTLLSLVKAWQIHIDIKGFCLQHRYHCSVSPHLGLTRGNSSPAWAAAETKVSIGTSTKHLISTSLQLPLLCQGNKNEGEITFPNHERLHKRSCFISPLYIVSPFYSPSFHHLFSLCHFFPLFPPSSFLVPLLHTQPPSYLLPASFPKCLLSFSLKLFLKMLLSCFKESTWIVHCWRKSLSQAGSLRQQISGLGAFPLGPPGCAEECCILLCCRWPALSVILPSYCCRDCYWGRKYLSLMLWGSDFISGLQQKCK